MVGACPYPVPQGSQVLLRDTALCMQERGHVVCLVVYGFGEGTADAALPVYRCGRIPFVTRLSAGPSWGKPLLDGLLTLTLRRVIREHRIDLIHAHNMEGLLVGLSAGKCPVIYHAHNAMGDELPYFMPCSGSFGKWLDRTFPRRADLVIAPHDRLGAYFQTQCGCLPERIRIIPPGIIDVGPGNIPAGMAPLPPVLYTGNLDSYQNLSLLSAAMTVVRQQIPEARLQVATAQEGDIAGAEKVYVPDGNALKTVLEQDCIVACPRVSWSGYPIKLVNALAAGRPIVACRSASPGLTHGHDALIVPDQDVAGFAGALIELLGDREKRHRLGMNARDTFRRRHDPSVVAEAIDCCYHQIIRA